MTNNSSTSITNPQKCLLIRTGIEIWIDEDRSQQLENVLTNNTKTVIKFEGRIINSVDIVGIFLPEDLDIYKRQKRGEWQCKKGNWHTRNEHECNCQREREYDDRGWFKA